MSRGKIGCSFGYQPAERARQKAARRVVRPLDMTQERKTKKTPPNAGARICLRHVSTGKRGRKGRSAEKKKKWPPSAALAEKTKGHFVKKPFQLHRPGKNGQYPLTGTADLGGENDSGFRKQKARKAV